MTHTKSGIKKRRVTILARYGEDYYRIIGKKGGKIRKADKMSCGNCGHDRYTHQIEKEGHCEECTCTIFRFPSPPPMQLNKDIGINLRKKILDILHKTEGDWDKEFLDEHLPPKGKCDLDLAAPRCAQRVKRLEKLFQSKPQHQIDSAVKEARIEELSTFYEWVQSEGRLHSEIKSHFENRIKELKKGLKK